MHADVVLMIKGEGGLSSEEDVHMCKEESVICMYVCGL